MIADLLALTLPGPASLFRRHLVVGFRQKPESIPLEEQIVVGERVKDRGRRFRRGLGKKDFGQFLGLEFARAISQRFPSNAMSTSDCRLWTLSRMSELPFETLVAG
jgi:hypothetical protein